MQLISALSTPPRISAIFQGHTQGVGFEGIQTNPSFKRGINIKVDVRRCAYLHYVLGVCLLLVATDSCPARTPWRRELSMVIRVTSPPRSLF